jgi:hypothetical protein
MSYFISQNRETLDSAHISDSIKETLLSEWYDEYYRILAIMSKIFDDNPSINKLGILFVIEDEIVIKGSFVNNERFAEVRMPFEGNGFKYAPL